MRKIFLLFTWLCLHSILFAQTFQLNWNGKKEMMLTNGQTIEVLKFNNEKNFLVGESFRPYFIHEEKSASNFQFQVVDVRKTELRSSEIHQTDYFPSQLDFIQNHHEVGGTIIHTLKLYPYYKEQNKYYRIDGFRLTKVSPKTTPSRKMSPNSSVLKTGDWYKIKVDRSGVYKLDRQFFQANGIPTSGYDLRSLKIFGNGGAQLYPNPSDFRFGDLRENAIQVIGEEDGNFDANDYVIFYAQGPHTLHRRESTTLQNLTHRFHQYDDYAYYFITFGGQNGKRVTTDVISESATKTFNSFDDYVFFEKDSLNINEMGRQWVSHPFYNNPNQTFELKLRNPISSANATLRASVVGKVSQNTNISISAAGSNYNFPTFSASQFNRLEGIMNISPSATVAVNLMYNNTSNPAGLAFLDKISIAYKAALNFSNEQFNFRFLDELNEVNAFSFSGAATIWNVSDLTNARIVSNNKFRKPNAEFYNEFVAFNESTLYTEVSFVEKVMNQDIRSQKNATAVVITPEEFLTEAQRWAEFRKRNDEIEVAVATTQQIYNDFASGSKDAFAIRDYLKHLKENGNPNLKYVMLLGDTTYDPKNRINKAKNYIPTFMSLNSSELGDTYSTDDYYTFIDNGSQIVTNDANDNLIEFSYNALNMSFAIGRMPAENMSEARALVNKTISYYETIPGKGTSFGDWRLKIIGVLDDEETGKKDINNPLIDGQLDAVFDEVNNEYYSIRKLYMDGFEQEQTSAGVRYPAITQGIVNGFELGANFISYFGHGGPSSWAQERVIMYEDISNLSNFNVVYSRLPIVSTVTCDFTVWDLPQYNSAGEQLIKNANGGALVMLTTNRPIGVGYGQNMNGVILEELFRVVDHQNVSIGEALLKSKQRYSISSADHKEVAIIGDPMIALARPKLDIRINSIKANGAVYPNEVNQLQALDFITIEGEVLNEAGQVFTGFNGTVSNTIYEKEVSKPFLRIWNPSQYNEQSTVIYKGSTKVENGKFVMEYYIPKDINYEVGERKFVFYAHNNKVDAVNVTNYTLGGLNENNMNDKEPPQGILYMNNLNFANGGITDRDPYLVGCLTDNMGISATGASIGHDIVATLDGNIQDSYVLNEYYEGGDNNPCINKNFKDYQKGQVVYQLKNLELGQHTVTMKFWDINNNSNTASLDFVVMESGSSQLHIDKLLNWPNPFTNNTYFHFEHNCDSELEVLVQIFTVSGKLVKSIKQYVTSEPFREGYRTNKYAIPWNGLDDFGDKIGKGVYIYKVNVKGVNSELCQGNAQAVEKLVILK